MIFYLPNVAGDSPPIARLLSWMLRCLCGFSTILLLVVLFLSLSDSEPGSYAALSIPQVVYILYTGAVHITLLFATVRRFFIVLNLPRKTKEILARGAPSTGKGAFSQKGDLNIAGELHDDEVIHAIILPNYCEDIGNLQDTLSVLAAHKRARTRYEIYIAMEEREPESAAKAGTLVSLFQRSFRAIQPTFHPTDLPGEVPGKGSNLQWAWRHIRQNGTDALRADMYSVVVTVIDCDSHLWEDYFTEIRRQHLADPVAASCTLYTCPNVFDRNSDQVSTPIRRLDAFIGISGLSCIPHIGFSHPIAVYSLPLCLLELIGGWDVDAMGFTEDIHLSLKAYFKTGGNLSIQQISIPCSQFNVPGEDGVFRSYASRYKAAVRHMWGALDISFVAQQTITAVIAKEWDVLLRVRYLGILELLWTYFFVPVHAVLLIFFPILYTYLSNVTFNQFHPVMKRTFLTTLQIQLAMGSIDFVTLVLYERWYGLCLSIRTGYMSQAKMTHVAFATRPRWYLKVVLEFLSTPLAGMLFGSAALLQASVMHFWTARLEWRVGKKPMGNANTSLGE